MWRWGLVGRTCKCRVFTCGTSDVVCGACRLEAACSTLWKCGSDHSGRTYCSCTSPGSLSSPSLCTLPTPPCIQCSSPSLAHYCILQLTPAPAVGRRRANGQEPPQASARGARRGPQECRVDFRHRPRVAWVDGTSGWTVGDGAASQIGVFSCTDATTIRARYFRQRLVEYGLA